jgi:hypothetical protein
MQCPRKLKKYFAAEQIGRDTKLSIKGNAYIMVNTG